MLLVQTLYGVQDVDPVATDTARSFGFSRRAAPVPGDAAERRALHRHRPAPRLDGLADPVVTAELVIGSAGLGRAINIARSGGNTELMYALIIVTGLLGLVLNEIFTRGESRVLHWHPSQRSTGGGSGMSARPACSRSRSRSLCRSSSRC